MLTLTTFVLFTTFATVVLGQVSGPIPVVNIKPWPSSSGTTVAAAADGSQTTGWISDPCRAGAWRSLSQFNLLRSSCARGFCAASCATNLTSATDNNGYTAGSSSFNHGEGRSWALFQFPAGDARTVFGIYIRGAWPVDTTLFGIAANGSYIPINTLQPSQTYIELSLPAPSFPISGLFVQAKSKDGVMRGFCYSGVGDCKTITVTEVAVQTESCYEELSMDLGSNRVITRMDVRFNGFSGGTIATSVDDGTYVNLMNLNSIPSSYFVQQRVPIANVTARYVRFRYH
jgi:hypothetical protein